LAANGDKPAYGTSVQWVWKVKGALWKQDTRF